MFFRRTTYLWAVQWETWQSPQPLNGDMGWHHHRTRWGEIGGASKFFSKMNNKSSQAHVRNVQMIRRPVGAVAKWLP